ncbi:hypothetical protein CcrC2_gp467 [Caulobacter phage C2]|nr:hypothetical protein CcrC2_gp467 [Caulobacter phage C2]
MIWTILGWAFGLGFVVLLFASSNSKTCS